MKALPGFDKLTNFMLNWTYVRWHIVELQGSHFHVTMESTPSLYRMVKDIAITLDVDEMPEVYTAWGYDVNGYTTGIQENTLMVLNSGAVDLLSEPQLRYVVGHEMGHVKSGHVIYHMMAQLIANMMASIPLGETMLGPIRLALLYWNRMSEFTADRADLLACQDKDEAVRAIAKMAGVPLRHFDDINIASFIKQAEEFERMYSGIADSVIKSVSLLNQSHPWTVLRAAELLKWVESGGYQKTLSACEAVICVHCGNTVPADAAICNRCGLNPRG